jgi:transcriptional regulator with XRE-family HTH domain
MAVSLESKMQKLTAAQRKKVEARTAEVLAEEMTLQDLRKARKFTQTHVAKALKITQDGVSRLEKRSDLLISTLRNTIQAMGGELSLVAEFPDQKPVLLCGIGNDSVIQYRLSRGVSGFRGTRSCKGIKTTKTPSKHKYFAGARSKSIGLKHVTQT